MTSEQIVSSEKIILSGEYLIVFFLASGFRDVVEESIFQDNKLNSIW